MEEYMVFHDGVELPVGILINMAMGAPDYHTAEHYLVSLLYCASMREDRRLLSKCQEIRKHFGISPYPELPASDSNLPPIRSREEEVRRYYSKESETGKFEILKKAIKYCNYYIKM